MSKYFFLSYIIAILSSICIESGIVISSFTKPTIISATERWTLKRVY